MRTRLLTIGVRGAAGALGAAALVAAPAGSAGATPSHGAGSQAAAGQPPGNNGTIKVDELTMDPGQDNDAHVSCGFSVSFFGFDSGTQHASIGVTPWAPTRGGHPATYTTGWTTSSRTGGNQFDANLQVSGADVAAIFSGVAPAHEGYHARIEAEVSGSRGSDDKFKMVWIEPCSTAGPASGTAATGGVTTPAVTSQSAASQPAASQPAATQPAATQSVSAQSVSAPSLAAPPTAGTAVLGETISRPATSPAGTTGAAVAGETLAAAPAGAVSPAGGSLPFTGADIAAETAAGLGLVAAGLVLVRRRRRS